MLAAAVTGVIQVVRLDGGELFSSSHGRVLLLKVIAVAAMMAVALGRSPTGHVAVGSCPRDDRAVADRFRRAFGAEAALGVVVLAFSGWMLTLTPPRVDPYAGEVYLPAQVFNDQTSGLEAKVFVGPGAVGLNGLKVEVENPPDGITNFTLRFVPPIGSDAFIVQQAIRSARPVRRSSKPLRGCRSPCPAPGHSSCRCRRVPECWRTSPPHSSSRTLAATWSRFRIGQHRAAVDRVDRPGHHHGAVRYRSAD